MSLQFLEFENFLPTDQPIIQTKGVQDCDAFFDLMTDPARRYQTIGLITGYAGRGKTIAISYKVSKLQSNQQTGLPSILLIKITPGATPKSLVSDIFIALQERPRNLTAHQLRREVIRVLLSNGIKLLVLDESNHLNDQTFDLLRSIFDSTGCNIIIVGLPRIEQTIARYETFSSRIGLQMKFPSLTESEILETVLPKLVFPLWQYDPKDEEDRILGQLIYKRVGNSFRNLRNVLQTACQTASIFGKSRIDEECILEAMRWTMTATQTQSEDQEESSAGENRGYLEMESEERKNWKCDRKTRS